MSIDKGNSNLSIDTDSSLENIENAPMKECNMQQAIPENSSKISNQSINKPMDKLMVDSDEILESCSLYAIEEDYRTATEEAIEILISNIQSVSRVKIGKNFIPPQIIANI